MAENQLKGTIIGDDPQGLDHNLTVDVEGPAGQASDQLHVRLPHPVFLRLDLAIGQRRALAIKADAIHLFG